MSLVVHQADIIAFLKAVVIFLLMTNAISGAVAFALIKGWAKP